MESLSASRSLLNGGTMNPVTDPQEPQVGELRRQPRRELEQIVVALEVKQPRDRPDDDVLVAEPEPAANFLARERRVQERPGLHPAVYRHVLIRPADIRG